MNDTKHHEPRRRHPPVHLHFWHNDGLIELTDGTHVTQWVCRGAGLDTCGAIRNRPPGSGAPPRRET